MTTTDRTRTAIEDRPATRNPLYSALIGLSALVVFLQFVWAGMIIREGKDYNATWVEIHSLGAKTAFVLALLATVVAIARMRSRRDLVIGSAALTVLIFVESYIGGIIGGHASAIAIHIPLGVAIFGLVVWLPMRAQRRA